MLLHMFCSAVFFSLSLAHSPFFFFGRSFLLLLRTCLSSQQKFFARFAVGLLWRRRRRRRQRPFRRRRRRRCLGPMRPSNERILLTHTHIRGGDTHTYSESSSLARAYKVRKAFFGLRSALLCSNKARRGKGKRKKERKVFLHSIPFVSALARDVKRVCGRLSLSQSDGFPNICGRREREKVASLCRQRKSPSVSSALVELTRRRPLEGPTKGRLAFPLPADGRTNEGSKESKAKWSYCTEGRRRGGKKDPSSSLLLLKEAKAVCGSTANEGNGSSAMVEKFESRHPTTQ